MYFLCILCLLDYILASKNKHLGNKESIITDGTIYSRVHNCVGLLRRGGGKVMLSHKVGGS